MKSIAVITGASSGIGKRFAQTVDTWDSFDEIWVVARRQNVLEELKSSVPFPIKPLALDLTERASFEKYALELKNGDVNVKLLVNCSGFGRFEAFTDTPLDVNLNMTDLNCQAVVAMCQLTLPYMQRGAKIINIASVAAFQPIPYINIYGATKAFVLSFSRALNRELKGRGISVTAVCPFWTKTGFFDRAVVKDKNAVVKKYVAMYETSDVVARAWKDARKNREISMYGFIARTQTLLTKLLPHKLIMDIWMGQQKLK